ncbi:hypothetical protein L596_014999 [Steinernema carpocapsae]|uniref:Uncharacterized protein n=1 Tax=Steinernema carpocapsae TaxID=34508 RepID=A0A4U5NEX3_STECR|nr:hypothetical protein L596_014999 [Steinernema carpocapsae]
MGRNQVRHETAGGTQEQIFRSYLYQYVFRHMYKHKRIFEHLLIAIADQCDVFCAARACTRRRSQKQCFLIAMLAPATLGLATVT